MLPRFGRPWPQTQPPLEDLVYKYPNHKTRGFLPPLLIPPLTQVQGNPDDNETLQRVVRVFGAYKFTDWRGQVLEVPNGVGDTKDRFEVSRDLPKNQTQLLDKPYSTRDSYLIFGDNSQDYFRHGLQILDGINKVPSSEFWDTQRSKESAGRTSLGSFTGTPFENSDPVIFGFDIIFDDISSPLLNGSINDFLQLFSGNISEIAARQPVYEEFKQQFVKFFKTRATVRIDTAQTAMTSLRPSGYADAENVTNLFSNGRKSYMNYYLKKITGLAKLIEGNTAETKSFLTDYNKDIITLSFTEDVSLSVGTLAHLYKLLYWSKPNAKTMIPENLLRFNCDIIVSEVRNFNRVRKSIENGEIEVIKDNVSRHIYSLKECQFYFNTLPHDDSIDLGAIKVFDTYDIQFDYKYSTVKFERFVPTGNGFGTYVGYDDGAIWKVGNPGSRSSQTGGTPSKYGKSIPAFFTVGQNKYNENGVTSPLITSLPGRTFVISEDDQVGGEAASTDPNLDDLKQNSDENKKTAAQNRENVATTQVPRRNSGDIKNITSALFDEEYEKIRGESESLPNSFSANSATGKYGNIIEEIRQKEFDEARANSANIKSDNIMDQIRQKQYDEARENNANIKSDNIMDQIRQKQFEEAQNAKLPESQLDLYSPPDGFKITTTEEALKKQKQGVKLSTNLRNALSRELQSAVNTRVGLLNKSLNKILNSVGVTGVTPPKNIYTGTQTGAGRIFSDIRGQLIEFLGNATGNLLS
jgi:hypothetical protein